MYSQIFGVGTQEGARLKIQIWKFLVTKIFMELNEIILRWTKSRNEKNAES